MEQDLEIRRGTPDDAGHCHEVTYEALMAYGIESGSPLEGTEEEWWSRLEPFYGLLAVDAAEWWIAEERASGRLIGFARSIDSSGLFELTEFFVRPGRQARGLGRELLDRAFPLGRGTVRAIIATQDVRALKRYYAAGTSVRFPVLGMSAPPNATEPPAGLTAARVNGDADGATVRAIEQSVLGFERTKAAWQCLLDNREAWLYRRDGADIGFAFVSEAGSGPIAALDPADLPGILLHVEDRAHAIGAEELSLEIPAPNEVATRHLLSRGFTFDPFVSYLMSDRPFGQFDRFIGFSPPLFL